MNILILYHSGIGSTKLIASIMQGFLLNTSNINKVDLFSIEDTIQSFHYDAYIIGFPTYHCSPSFSILSFIKNFKKLDHKKPLFIYTTCGLYSANTLRIFAKICLDKNLISIHSASYRCPASDGILVFPKIKFFTTFEKNIKNTIHQDLNQFLKNSKNLESFQLPRFKFYSILNYPNKKIAEFVSPNIYLNQKRCISCTTCIRNCPHHCFEIKNNYPSYTKTNCEHCYRCIHLCPTQALSLKKRKHPKKQLLIASLDTTIKK